MTDRYESLPGNHGYADEEKTILACARAAADYLAMRDLLLERSFPDGDDNDPGVLVFLRISEIAELADRLRGDRSPVIRAFAEQLDASLDSWKLARR